MRLRELGFQFQGVVYRGHNPRWQHAPESGEGAARNGGRWNPVGLPALYTSERFETAWLEAQQGFPYKTQPLTLCTYEVDCGPLLDLCNPAIQERVHANPKAWMQEAWLDKKMRREPILAWAIVDQLIEEGFAGIRVPSQANGATHRDTNIVFWQWSRRPPTKVRVIDDDNRLPSEPQSGNLQN
ncbi:RES domain-containing protein [Modicisalibacter xianhensis]|uniref:RES domain-containing protein n=1 Tax=Modicisalibacter xianhensis TaxID=442341 RepID=A0A4R8F9Y6_9GAMM|nr:RES domain-containing protein [Halomonas xianhensis]